MSPRRDAEGGVGHRPQPRGEHMVGPDAEPDEADRDPGEHHELIPEQGLPREDRQDLREDAEGGEDQHVDLRVSEEPEEVLPQDRVRPRRGIEEVRPQLTVEQQLEQRDRDDRQGEGEQQLHHEPHPHEHGHAEQRHPRRPEIDDRDGEVHSSRRRGDPGDDQPDRVEAHPDRRIGGRVRRVAEPSAVRRASEEEARVQEQAAEQEHPVAVRVQPWERDVPRTDHQRDEVVEERRRHRHHEQEDHRDPVHREDLVVLIGVQQRALGLSELGADQQRLDTSDDEEHEGRHPVQDPDLLVVDGREPAREPGHRRRAPEDAFAPPGHRHARHRSSAPSSHAVLTSGCRGTP